MENEIIVAATNKRNYRLNELNDPCSIYVDDEQTIYVADQDNHSIIEWKKRCSKWSSCSWWKWARISKISIEQSNECDH